MSTAEDARKVIQDLVAPELQVIWARLGAIEANLRSSEAIVEARHQALLAQIEMSTTIQTAKYEAIMRAFDIEKRLEKIEARQSATA